MTIFRFRLALTASALLLFGCGSTGQSKNEIRCNSSPKVIPPLSQLHERSLAITTEARLLKTKMSNSEFSAGFWATLASKLPATKASETAHQIALLRTKIANQKAFEFAIQNNGNSPLPGNSPWACKMLADSVASFGINNSKDHVVKSLESVEAHFTATARLFDDGKE